MPAVVRCSDHDRFLSPYEPGIIRPLHGSHANLTNRNPNPNPRKHCPYGRAAFKKIINIRQDNLLAFQNLSGSCLIEGFACVLIGSHSYVGVNERGAGDVDGLRPKDPGLSRLGGENDLLSIRCGKVIEFSRDLVKAPPALGGLGVEKLSLGLLYSASLPKLGLGLCSISLLK